MTSSPPTDQSPPLKGSLRLAISQYVVGLRAILSATFLPLLCIAALRYLSDDYTGDQYSLLIGLISIFVTMVLARLALTGWDRKTVRLLALYNAILSRYLSGIGLVALFALHIAPAAGGLFIVVLTVLQQIPAIWVLAGIPLLIVGGGLLLHAVFALYALMDDMALSVMQAFRISGRLARRYWRPIVWRAVVAMLVVFSTAIALGWLGTWAAPFIQDAWAQLVLDALLGWVITPFAFVYVATIYQRLVEAYE